ncbi:MAG: type II toxin-antitoxin system VapC family toxin [Anaerolineales bacterium]
MDANAIFIDTNVLVYASVDAAPLHNVALQTLAEYEAQLMPLWISRQILREYLATLARPSVNIPLAQLTAAVRAFETRYRVAEDSAAVTTQLLKFVEQGQSYHIHDTNIVATMLVYGISQLLTHNVKDFEPFQNLITVIALK